MSITSSNFSRMPEYRTWINMKSRCNTPSSTGFENYGGRGIRVHPEWEASFAAFIRDMGMRPSRAHSLDRIDVNGNYEPANCRWATKTVQSRNMRSNKVVAIAGAEITLVEAVERTGLLYNTVLYRLKRGWRLEDALRAPPHKGVRP